MYNLGVLGGMGPLATAIFLERVVRSTKATSDQEHIDILVLNHSTMPDRTGTILNNLDPKVITEPTKKDLKIFEFANVKNIAIPCNTYHYYYDDIAAMTDINIIHMPKETLKEFKQNYGTKIAILSTTGTKRTRVYEDIAVDMGMSVVNLEDYSDEIDEIIYNVKETNQLKSQIFEDIVIDIDRRFEPDGFILACTELSIVDRSNLGNYNILDAMDILVKKSIEKSGYETK